MILDLDESKELCEWLLERGIGLGEAAHILSDIECGKSFSLALLKVFIQRKIIMENTNEGKIISDWGNPVTP